MADINMRQMLEAGVHFGHQTRYWSPKMAPYIFGSRNKIHIINLEATLPLFQEAMNFLGSITAAKGTVLFVGTKRQASKLVREQAQRCGCPFVDHRWLGGMLTNFKTVKNSIARLIELDELNSSGAIARLSKKEALSLERQRSKLDRSLSGIRDMKSLPDCVFIIDVEHEKIAVAEAKKLKIPLVGIVDTNSSPEGIDYPVPGNDDAIRAIRLYLSHAADAILEAKSILPEVIGGDAEDYVEVSEDMGVAGMVGGGQIEVSEPLVAPEEVPEATPAPTGEGALSTEIEKSTDEQAQ
ncbi:MAG TPA: 30S ribosomal protein S2 [Gammaproteobacteria bacterium]|jgi:small subunit ribosomal protein S2|nr:30S ribosomal protein S2 [Gammaproteobacteria bacterium]HAD37857.1 30S ribosomal protein S2 [Gammaproteobacteria bacterium]HBK76948.1 30S ribosomal protein S2 [Gammaproteobacteria bacterium]HIA40828.1 30S ribosomal protein S2 [Gammaproteobacteria bacterium]HIB82823.1 30S ribosomal protein S2 [Gammaproteobacteria bacterium]